MGIHAIYWYYSVSGQCRQLPEFTVGMQSPSSLYWNSCSQGSAVTSRAGSTLAMCIADQCNTAQ